MLVYDSVNSYKTNCIGFEYVVMVIFFLTVNRYTSLLFMFISGLVPSAVLMVTKV